MAGARDERVADLYLIDQGGDPSEEGQVRLVGPDIKAFVGGAVTSLLTGSGISAATHEALDTFVHGLAEDAYVELTRASGKVSNVTAWEDSNKLKKLREVDFTRSAGKVTQLVGKMYDGAGAEVTDQRLTVSFTRAAGKVSSIDVAKGVP